MFNSEESFFVTEEDISLAQGDVDVIENKQRIFRYSSKNTEQTQDTKLDSILLKFNCIDKDGNYDGVNSNLPTSNSCIFAIGVYGK